MRIIASKGLVSTNRVNEGCFAMNRKAKEKGKREREKGRARASRNPGTSSGEENVIQQPILHTNFREVIVEKHLKSR